MNALHKFCPRCGTALVISCLEGRNYKSCPADDCQFIDWNNPIPVAVTLISRRHKLALVKRKLNPRKGFWCPPCGFINEGESPADGARRESKEESKLTVVVDEVPFHVATPKGVNEHIWFFRATSFTGTLGYDDDADDAGWFSIDDLPELAFDTHREVVLKWFKRPSVRIWRRLALLAAKVGIEL